MKIVFVGNHCCIRLTKEAMALGKKHDLHIIGFNKPATLEYVKTFVHCQSKDHLKEAIKLHDDADIIHVHNEPNWLVPVIREVYSGPLILDVHDSMAYRSDKPEHVNNVMERTAFDLCDGMVLVSEKCAEITKTNKPSCILPSFINEEFMSSREHFWVGGAVYQGLLSTDKTPEVMQYANYKRMEEEFDRIGVPLHLYSPKRSEWDWYYKKAIIEEPLPFNVLIKTLGQFDWGVLGNIDIYKDWQVAFPNKLFDYMAAGIPIVAFNAEAAGTFVEKHGIGIHVKSADEFLERYEERQKCQSNVFRKRQQWTMENQIHVVEDLYKKVIHG